jgi:hypothetical protein
VVRVRYVRDGTTPGRIAVTDAKNGCSCWEVVVGVGWLMLILFKRTVDEFYA